MKAGASASASRNFKAAKIEYAKALGESEKFGINDWRIAKSLLKLGATHVELDEYAEAKPLIERALKIYESAKEVERNHFELSQALCQLGNILKQENDFVKAEDCYQRALIICKETLDPTHLWTADVLADWAAVKVERSQYFEAEQLYKEAFEIMDRVTPKDIRYSAHLDSLALCYKLQGKLVEAERAYKQALDIAATGSDKISYVVILQNLAFVTLEANRLGDAQEKFEQCLPIVKKESATRYNNRIASITHDGLGLVAYRRDNFTEAANQFEQSLSLLHLSFGDSDRETMVSLRLLDAYERLNRYKDAELLLRRMLLVDEKLYGQTSPEVAADVSRLAQLLRKQGDTIEASILDQRSKRIKASLPGATNLNAPQIRVGAPSPDVAAKVKDKWAVVIGVSEFKDNSLNLKYAAKDALDFKSYLIEDAHFQPDHVKLLLNKEATRQGIISTLGAGWLGRLANRDDLVVIFISTHGTKAAEDGTNFIVPYDCSIDDFLLTGIPMQWFTTGIGKMVHSNRLVFIIDVCHASATGSATTETAQRSMLNPDAITLGTGQILLTSSDLDQSSWESRTFANGVFTYRLLEALRMYGSNISLIKAYQQMRERVEQDVLRERGKLQTPTMIKRWSGEDPNLGVAPAAPRTATISK